MYESTIPVIEKYGKNCKLNENNIKDIYFMMGCNNSVNDYEITQYLEKHYNKEEILQWNDEYINNELDLCHRLLSNTDWDSISTIGTKIYELCRAFTAERSTYERIIDFLKKFYDTYGYFMNYYILKKLPEYPYEDKSFSSFQLIYIYEHRKLNKLELWGQSTGAEWRYLKDDGYFGMIPRFHKLGYKDLLDRVLIELIIPIFDHLYEKNSIMEKFDIQYIKLEKTVEEFNLRKVIMEYFQLFHISVPEEAKKYL